MYLATFWLFGFIATRAQDFELAPFATLVSDDGCPKRSTGSCGYSLAAGL